MKRKFLIAACSFMILGTSVAVYAGGVTSVEVKKDNSEKKIRYDQ